VDRHASILQLQRLLLGWTYFSRRKASPEVDLLTIGGCYAVHQQIAFQKFSIFQLHSPSPKYSNHIRIFRGRKFSFRKQLLIYLLWIPGRIGREMVVISSSLGSKEGSIFPSLRKSGKCISNTIQSIRFPNYPLSKLVVVPLIQSESCPLWVKIEFFAKFYTYPFPQFSNEVTWTSVYLGESQSAALLQFASIYCLSMAVLEVLISSLIS